jgi:ArsR family transcriptional regulator, arsenate/arsenite/antimonite-responsive transcriptional repressor
MDNLAHAGGSRGVKRQDPILDRIHVLKPFFMALGSNVRLRIVATLAEHGEMAVSDLARSLRISQPLVSWHLGRLRQGGIIRQRQEGRLAYCSVDGDHIRACERMLAEILNSSESKSTGEGRSG